MEGRTGRVAVGGALVVLALLAIVLGSAPGGDADEAYPSRRIDIMAPASPGGGWDTTAREFQGAIQDGKLGDGAEVFNVDGAGGTLGLSELVAKDAGDPYQLMITGLVMMGAVETNGTEVTLADTTPIATLTTEPEAIVVPANSKYETLDDLAQDLKADSGSIRWAGGSAGGTDQILVGQLAAAVGGDPRDTKYVAYSGGGEANAAILSGAVDAGSSGLSEFLDLVEAGKLRLLAVSSPTKQQVDGKTPQTIEQQGIDLELTNWRAIVAPPDLPAGEREKIARFVQRVVATQAWQDASKRNDWGSFVQTGAKLDAFLKTEQAKTAKTIAELGIAG